MLDKVSERMVALICVVGTDVARIAGSVMHGHISALSTIIFVGEELAHKVLQGKATLLENSCLPILCEYRIVWSQCCCGSDTDAFFTRRYLGLSTIGPIIFNQVKELTM